MIKNPKLADVQSLLEDCGLPYSDITSQNMEHFFALGAEASLSGVVGLEIYGDVALLRSLAVSPKHRNSGVGKQLVTHAEKYAFSIGVRSVYLLTTTADKFFLQLGYSPLSRSQAPASITRTTEFSSLCPSSSVFMVKKLGS